MTARLRLSSSLLFTLAVAACVLAPVWAWLTQVVTDPAMNMSLWTNPPWGSVAWALTAIGALAAAAAFGGAYGVRHGRGDRQRSVALAGLAIYGLAALLWILGLLTTVQPVGSG